MRILVPFCGLSLCAKFKLPNYACVSGWSCLMNLILSVNFNLGTYGHLSVYWVAGLFPARNFYEVEMHTVYQGLFFKKLEKTYTPCNTSSFVRLKVFEKGWVHTSSYCIVVPGLSLERNLHWAFLILSQRLLEQRLAPTKCKESKNDSVTLQPWKNVLTLKMSMN